MIKFKNLVESAEEAYKGEKYLKALQLLYKALSLGCTFPERDIAEAYQLRGIINFKLGDIDRSIDDLNESILINPKDDLNFYLLGLFEVSNSKYKEGLNNFDKAIKLNPNESDYFNIRGESKQFLDQYDEAIKDFDKAIELNPNESNYFYNRGISRFSLHQYDEAIEDIDRSIYFDPYRYEYYERRGDFNFVIGEYFDAIEDYDKAIGLDPSNSYCYTSRGESKFYLNKHEEAIRDYDIAIEYGYNDAEVFALRGFAKFELMQYDASLKDLDISIKKNKEYNSNAYIIRGNIFKIKGCYRLAMLDYDKAIKYDSNLVKGFYYRALLKNLQENFKDALSDCIHGLLLIYKDSSLDHEKEFYDQLFDLKSELLKNIRSKSYKQLHLKI